MRKQQLKKMLEVVYEGTEQALNEFNPSSQFLDINPNIDNALYFLHGGDGLGCPVFDPEYLKKDEIEVICRANIFLRKPKQLQARESDWLTKEPSVYYFSAARGYIYNEVKIDPRDHKSPTAKLLTLLSKNLPEWIFIYVAPNESMDEHGEQIDYPYILNKGQLYLFIKEKEENWWEKLTKKE